jgi:ribosomal protein S18 acetylase RimI-like enzyme
MYVAGRAGEFDGLALPHQQLADLLHMQFEAQRLHYEVHYPDAEHSLVLLGETPVGRMTVQYSRHELHLIDIAILPLFRRRGIATSLLEGLMADARERGVPVRLFVDPANPARNLYERLGFNVTGREGVDLQMQWE